MRISSILKPLTHLKIESFQELSDQRFGSQIDPGTNWDHYQSIVEMFFEGLYTAIDTWNEDSLIRELDRKPGELRGFAYEGAGMGLIILDSFLPYRRRFDSFAHGVGTRYETLLQIGAGMAFGYLGEGMPVRLIRRDPNKFVDRQDPLLRWLVLDGYGFFDGMVNWQKVITRQKRPDRMSGYGLRAYDQGVGRSLWICTGGDPGKFCQAIRNFPQSRQADLWGGIGEACAYAGGVDDFARIRHLAHQAADHADQFAAGIVIGSWGRVTSGEKVAHTDLACEAIWESSSLIVTEQADQLSAGLADTINDRDRYEQWRIRIRQTWAAEHRHVAALKSP